MRPSVPRQLTFAILAVVLVAAAPLLAAADVAPPGDQRDRLTFDELMAEMPNRDGPIHNDYFMPVGVTEPVRHEFEGMLEIAPTSAFAGSNRFPDFSASFFSVDGYLVPVERDIIRSPSIGWDIILSPGRVWSEPGDNGWSRASFPFTLLGRKVADSHGGLATFVFNDSEVSDLHVQVVQENIFWGMRRFDAWSRLPLTYQPGPIDGRTDRVAQFLDELAQRIPTAPIDSLLGDTELIDAMDRNRNPFDLPLTGLVVDGVLYLGPCPTRFGDYPYCGNMRQQVGSVTKSTTAALALLWLAEAYGAEVFDLKIVDYVDVTAGHDGWRDVSFQDAIDMATGIGDLSPDPTTSVQDSLRDAGRNSVSFTGVATARDKLDVAFTAGNYDWGPGEVFRYSDQHTFVVAAAMDAYLKSVEGPDANLWDRVTVEVLKPIGIHHAPLKHTQEPDGQRGVPIMAWGFLPTVDDLAKIGQLYQDRGAHDGQQLLFAEEIDMLLQGDPERGLPLYDGADETGGRGSYDFSLWYVPYSAKAGCQPSIPYMSGAGGNFVVLMPNGMTGIRLGTEESSYSREAENMAALADGLRSFCNS